MKKHRVLLFVAGLAALIVGYIELRLPMPVVAQGRDAVFGRLAVTGGARISDDLSIGNALTFGTALTPAMTAKLAATGTASAATFLRGDGAWVAIQDVYWDWTQTTVSTTSSSTWSDLGLGFSITTSATNTVILDLDLSYISYYCRIRVTGGSSELESINIAADRYFSITGSTISIRQVGFDVRLVDTPGAGTHAYKVQVRKTLGGSSCLTNDTIRLSTFTAQVLP